MTNVSIGLVLVDTNVFVYAADPSDPNKQRIAASLLDRLALANRGALSAQVLGEAFNVLTRQVSRPVSPDEAASVLLNLARSLVIYPITAWAVEQAFQAVRRYQMSYWDALIWATAKLNNIAVVLTEDIQSSGAVEGVRFVNPFLSDFELNAS